MSEREYTDLQIERIVCGDVSATEQAAFDKDASVADKERLEALREENREFLESVGPHKQAVLIAERVKSKNRGFRIFAPMILVASAAVGLFILRPRPPENTDSPDILTKGSDIRFKIHLATDAGSRSLMPGDSLPPNARLRFEIVHDQAGYAAVVGVDSAKVVSVYFPSSGSESAAYDPSASELPGAIEVDDTPGSETFYAIFSKRPFDAKAVGSALLNERALGAEVQFAEMSLAKSVDSD